MAGKIQEIILKVPTIADGETLKYRLLEQEGQDPIGYLTLVVNRTQNNGSEAYRVHARTEYDGKGLLEETAVYEIGEGLRPLSYNKVITSDDGKVLMEAEETYDDGTINIEANTTTQSVPSLFPFRGGPFKPNAPFADRYRVTFYCIMPPAGKPFKMYAEATKEKVKVPAGTIECFKMQWTPDIECMMEQWMPAGFKAPPGFETLATNFMPPTLRWYSQKEPHYPVKAEGTIISPVPFLKVDPWIAELISIG